MFNKNITITEIILIIQTLILIGGFVIGVRQIILLRVQIRSQLDWQCKNATFEYLKKFTTLHQGSIKELQKKINILILDGRQPDMQDILKKLAEPGIRMALYELLSYFEHLAVGIEEKYFNESICKKVQYNTIVKMFKLLKPYILIRRNETGSNIGKEFEELVGKWEK